MGASFDRSLWSSVGQTIGAEARALYNQGVAGIYLFTPNVNPSRDQRWYGLIRQVYNFCSIGLISGL